MLVLRLSNVIPLWGALVIVQFAILTEPVMLLITMPSSAAVPAESVMAIQFKFGLSVLVIWMPSLVEFAIVPPLPALPVPTSLSPPEVPVEVRIIPLGAPLEEMLRNSNLFTPIVVFTTFKAVPVVDVSVLTNPPVAAGTQGFSSHTLTVAPAPVALNPIPEVVLTTRPPRNVTVPPVLVRSIAFAVVVVALMAPLKVVAPLVLALMSTALAALLVLVIVPL